MLLTATSYIVLGLLDRAGEATPYELKQAVARSVGNFWSVPHSQLYAEPERLARAGLVAEKRENEGRRRRQFSLTDAGREALEAWRAESPDDPLPELRDAGLLRLFFGADPRAVAEARLERHRAKLRGYEELLESAGATMDRGPRLALEAGIAHEREWVRFWEQLEEERERDG